MGKSSSSRCSNSNRKPNKDGGSTGGKQNNKSSGGSTESLILVDPARIRFQHSRIRPHFSGCGRHLNDTLESIRSGLLRAEDLPPIQVLVGPQTDDGPWYFSLNNRRLWVLKRCREEGLLAGNQIAVRVRTPKSASEASRYTVENCAAEAKLMRETTAKLVRHPSSVTQMELASQSAESDGDAEETTGHDDD